VNLLNDDSSPENYPKEEREAEAALTSLADARDYGVESTPRGDLYLAWTDTTAATLNLDETVEPFPLYDEVEVTVDDGAHLFPTLLWYKADSGLSAAAPMPQTSAKLGDLGSQKEALASRLTSISTRYSNLVDQIRGVMKVILFESAVAQRPAVADLDTPCGFYTLGARVSARWWSRFSGRGDDVGSLAPIALYLSRRWDCIIGFDGEDMPLRKIEKAMIDSEACPPGFAAREELLWLIAKPPPLAGPTRLTKAQIDLSSRVVGSRPCLNQKDPDLQIASRGFSSRLMTRFRSFRR
jgi:hypothetical protein